MKALRFVNSRRCAAALAAVTLSMCIACPTWAALIFRDTFSGPVGNLSGTTPTTSGTNWLATAAAATPIQTGTGTAVVGTSGQDEYSGFSGGAVSTASGSITTSFDVNVTSAAAAGDYFLHLSNPLATSSNFYQRFFARSSGQGFQFGITETSGGAIVYGTTVLTFGTSNHVDIKWTFVPGATNDTLAVSVGGSPYVNTTFAVAEPTNLAAVNLRQGTAANAPALTVDNLTVNFVPEPATMGLAAFSLLGLVAARRRA
jgi:hypothetical protein